MTLEAISKIIDEKKTPYKTLKYFGNDNVAFCWIGMLKDYLIKRQERKENESKS